MDATNRARNISKRGFASMLWRLADLVRVTETRNSFRSKAYRSAVWALDDLPGIDLSDEELLSTPGIGPGVTALVHEYRSSGAIDQLIPLEEGLPREAPRLRRLPRMTPNILRDLKSLGVETTSDLIGAIDSGAAASVRGAGAQTLQLWRAILQLPPHPGLIPSHQAWAAATQLGSHIARHTGAEIQVAGSVRRMEEWVDRLDLVAISDDPETIASFMSGTAVLSEPTIDAAGIYAAETHSGEPLVLRVAPPDTAGSIMLLATGPRQHVLDLDVDTTHSTEENVYRAAGLEWIPPAARGRSVPEARRVVRIEDLKGDLHVHSDLSPDGRMEMEAIVQDSIARGYDYVLMTDHTEGLRFGGLGPPEIQAQSMVIAQLQTRYPEITILHGAELNIMRDGSLDLRDDILEVLDFAVAGVHSYFGLDRDSQTMRVVTALNHPVVGVLAHPFGRRIGIRPPMDIDMKVIIDVAAEQGVALETNGHRDRLDLPADWIEIAAQSGVSFASNSDAHRLSELDNIANAIATLQRAGVGPDRVINAGPIAGLPLR